MIQLVVLGGSGDAFLVCSLYRAFCDYHQQSDVEVVLHSRLAPVAQMFEVPYRTDDDLVLRAQNDHQFQADYDNDRLSHDRPFYAHPCFLRSRIRVDWLTTRWDASQADMYRLILGIPPSSSLLLPRVPNVQQVPNSVMLITESTSWPNTQPAFWTLLGGALRRAGWSVVFNDLAWSLEDLLTWCAGAEWVIGPQCGVMSILVSGRFACRKTLCTPNLDGNRRPEYLAPETYPYGYVTKFTNLDFEVEEFKVSDDDHAEVVEMVLNGVNGRRLAPHDPSPVLTVQAPLAPGDFLDRLAILEVKRQQFDRTRCAGIEREYQRCLEVKRQLPLPPQVEELYQDLVRLHDACFVTLGQLVPAVLEAGGEGDFLDHAAVIRANRRRVELKQAIDRLCHSPYTEVKDYYQDAE